MDIKKLNERLYYVGHPDFIRSTEVILDVIRDINKEVEEIKKNL